MSARRVRLALIVVAILLFVVPILLAQDVSHARIVRLSYMSGQVTIDRNDGQGAEKAILNMPIIQGTRLIAEENSRLEVEFENGGTVRLMGPGELVFRELSLRGNGDKVSYVDVRSGLAYFDVQLKRDDDFRVEFDKHDFTVRKSSHFRVNVDLDVQKLAVFKGELRLEGVPDEVAVKKDETISFDSTDAQRYYLAKGYDSLGPDEWDKNRDQDRETLARSEEYKNALAYTGSPYSYGTWDLARYGNFFYNPGYGWLWQPFNWGMGTSPFDYGAWSYYPGAGWVFVSYYPWGWTPYRYGGWSFVPGYGWCWRPGGYGSGWYSSPVVYNPPAAYQPPQPPAGGPGPTRFVGGRRWPDINPATGQPTDRGDRFRKVPKNAAQDQPVRTPTQPATGSGVVPTPTTAQPETSTPTAPAVPGKRWGAPEGKPDMKPQAPPQNLPPQSAPPPRHISPPPPTMRGTPDSGMRSTPQPAPRMERTQPAPPPRMERAPPPPPPPPPPATRAPGKQH